MADQNLRAIPPLRSVSRDRVPPKKGGIVHIGVMADCTISCHKTIELHHKRHCEIGSLLQRIRDIDSCVGNNVSRDGQRRRAKEKAGMEELSPDKEDERAHDAETSEWNDSSTQNDDDVGFRKGELWYQGLDTAAERKAVKAARKSARNQTRFELPAALDLRRVENVLHPESQASALKVKANDEIDQKSREQPWCSPNCETRPLGSMDVIQHILKELGIELAPARNSKERRSLLTKLQLAVRNDLESYSNEQAETMQRMAGYWRYANRRTYNFMVRTNQVWDWETGEKLLEVEDNDVAEDDGEHGENMSGTTEVTAVSQSQDDGQDSKHKFDECGDHSESMLPGSSDTSNQPDAQIHKDDRILDKTIRPASPPRDTGPSPSPRYCTLKKKPKSKAASTKKSRDTLSNVFGALKFEVPAPCEDPQLPTGEEATVQRAPPSPVHEQAEPFPPLTNVQSRTGTPSKGPPKQNKVLNITVPPKAKPSVSHAVRTSKSKNTGGAKRRVQIGVVAKRASGDTAGVNFASDSWTDVVKGMRGRR